MKLFFFLLFVWLLGCKGPENAFSLPKNPYAAWARHPAWTELKLPAGEWRDRYGSAPIPMVSALQELNQIDGISLVVKPASVPVSWEKEKTKLLFPIKVESLFQRYLAGIYFVSNLGSTGVSVLQRDSNGRPIAGWIFLDVDLIQKKGNDWLFSRESSPFEAIPPYSFDLQIVPPASDSLAETYSWILLHEFGHVLSVVLGHVPDFSEEVRDFTKYSFFEGVWATETDSFFDKTILPERQKLRFYTKPVFPLYPDGFHFLKKIKNTPFVTPYSANNADDTYAESFTSYVHCIMMQKPYWISIKKGEEEILHFSNGILGESGRRPREFFQRILGN